MIASDEVEWTVDRYSGVTIEGQISPASILADKPMTRNRRNRVQLCPADPWAISFYLPGPVDWWTASVIFTTNNFMEILVMKSNPSVSDPTASASGTVALASSPLTSVPVAETSAVGPTASVPVAETSAAGPTTLVPVPDLGPRPEGDGWFE
jgi:hypothetical protein